MYIWQAALMGLIASHVTYIALYWIFDGDIAHPLGGYFALTLYFIVLTVGLELRIRWMKSQQESKLDVQPRSDTKEQP